MRQQWKERRRAALAGAIFAAAVGLVAWLPRLAGTAELGALEKLGCDLAQIFDFSSPLSTVVIVEMDQKSFKELGQETGRLWDRTNHVNLLRKLSADRARVVVFDVLFDTARTPSTDQAFATAMRQEVPVLLAAMRQPGQGPGAAGLETVLPWDLFRDAAAGVGLVDVHEDRDGAVRQPFRQSDARPSLPRLAAEKAGAAALPPADVSRWLRYPGNPATELRRLSYVDALRQPEGFFRDKHVFIGSALQVKLPGEPTDFFRTPFTRWDGSKAPGVTLLATEFMNLIQGNSLRRWPVLSDLLLLMLGAALVSLVCTGMAPRRAALGALLAALALAVLGSLAQAAAGWVCSWVLVAGVVVPAGWAWAAAHTFRQHQQTSASASAPTLIEPATETQTARMLTIPDHDLLIQVGRGAYGEVWLARNLVGMYRAVKIIHRHKFAEAGPFDREFNGVRKFMPISTKHPGFVNIHHVGRDDALGCFFIIMEPADDMTAGQAIEPGNYRPKTLDGLLKQRRRLPAGELLQLALPLASALDCLHSAGLIHRDIKPGNIIFAGGVPKLADIGLVTDVARDGGAVSYLGTRGYIAPEGPGSPAADIFSLGKVLYEAFTGLDRGDFPVLPASLLESPDAASILMNQIVLRACEMDPNRRYRSARELMTDLETLPGRLQTEV